MALTGILGGTFDPVHCGHLRLALEMRGHLGLDTVRLMPAPAPRLRDAPHADAKIRLRLLEAALDGLDGLIADATELDRPGPTRSIDTLEALRAQDPDTTLCLLLGMDAFARLPEWHRWKAILEHAHIGVACRPGAALPPTGPLAQVVRERQTDDPDALRRVPAGHVILRQITALDISATRIRALVAAGASPRFLVPDSVCSILETEGIY